MRKRLILLMLLLGLVVLWRRYGYLLQSVQNLPDPSPVVSDLPQAIPGLVSDPDLSRITLRDGYVITYFARDVPGARSMTRGANGVIYVGTRTAGVVYALDDPDNNGRADTRYVVASGLDTPNGVAYLDGTLYVAELSRIIAFDLIDTAYRDKPGYRVVYDKLPNDTAHGWKYLAVGPDKMLYISIGMPCNVCDDQGKYGQIIRIDPSQVNGKTEVVATGIRNTVGFDWGPNGSLWFTDNGRDWLGDDAPADELNEVTKEGKHYGFPYCHGGDTLDPEYGKDKSCSDYEKPVVKLGAHVAALGMKFVYDNMILIAEHGSWNRTTPVGYRITSFTGGQPRSFAEGWLRSDGTVTGRPVDILLLPDRSFLVSDDFSGSIYRISPTQ